MGRLASNAAVVLLLGLAAMIIVPAVLGFHRYVILTGSMTGTYDTGSIVFDRPVPVGDLEVGDVITYEPPPGASPNQERVTHRIVDISRSPDGRPVFRTKGDANATPDPWTFMLANPTQDRVEFSVPYVGYAFMLLSVREARMALIGVPALLIALWLAWGMWREAGEVARGAGPPPEWVPDTVARVPTLAPLAVAVAPAAPAAVRLPVNWRRPAPSRRAAVRPA